MQHHYAQIEKELLVIIFGLEQFHQYVYAWEVTVHTDHKPLEAIAKKLWPWLHGASNDFYYAYPNAYIMYLPGKGQRVADALSRTYVSDTSDDDNLDAQVHAVMSTLPMPDGQLQELRFETEMDEDLQALRDFILISWPGTKSEVPLALHEYSNFRDE